MIKLVISASLVKMKEGTKGAATYLDLKGSVWRRHLLNCAKGEDLVCGGQYEVLNRAEWFGNVSY